MEHEVLHITSTLESGRQFRESICKAAGTDVTACYQCGKCTAGCPVSFAMDIPPRQVMRLVQLGMEKEALHSRTIWLCAGCHTCSTRCPKSVDIAAVMEALRIKAKKAGITPDKSIDSFHDIFLNSVEKFGRVHEMGLIINFNLKTMQPMKDAMYGPAMLKRGKLHILPEKIHDHAAVKKIFEKVRRLGGEE